LKPGDDLILLAVQQLLYMDNKDNSSNNKSNANIIAAVLLESAIEHSPDNAYLKFAAIDIYHRLDATSRSWELFQTIGIKHIQLDSCSFTILPHLFEGGLYNETIEVSSSLLRFQGGTARDCGDFAFRAMEGGTLSKADEFLVFQREKMNQSLTFQFSKGLILDAAPLLATPVPRKKHDDDPIMKGGVGITQGIVGGDEDSSRAIQMVVESHNPYAALSIVSWAHCCGNLDDAETLSDNRDLSILNQNSILLKPKIEKKRQMVQDTLRRGHIHGLLIRATLCVDAMKGPKKGKLVKPSSSLEKRTKSLLDSVLTASEFFDRHMETDKTATAASYLSLLHTILCLCRFLSIVNAGMPLAGDDSLEQREQQATDLMRKQGLLYLKQARENLNLTSDVKTVGSMLPNYIVPIFALFRMCSNVCTVYGWGKRKQKTKIVSAAMAEFALELNGLIQGMLTCIKMLPHSETESTFEYVLSEQELSCLDADGFAATKRLLNRAQYRTRIRMEPVLQEMDEELDEFKCGND
jgi:N-terminal acetyltransferase B complex non-catalytic subunit